jgi:purine-nucleoside phosphorylase
MPIPTPHINAPAGAFADTVLMPGDPLRSKLIADKFLENAELVNNVRGVQGYTGTWKGKRVSVMASGMGASSIGIYSYELFNMYDVENIIRVGSAGALQDNINVMDIVIAQAACTNSGFLETFHFPGTFAPIADYTLMQSAVQAADAHGATWHVGNIFSTDNFYNPKGYVGNEVARQMGVLAVEMEAAALYATAAYLGKRALCICTISDHIFKTEQLSPEERQTGFNTMIEIALDAAAAMEK